MKTAIKTAEDLLERFFREAEGRTNRQIDVDFALEEMGLTRASAREGLDYLSSRGLINTFGPDIAFLTELGAQAFAEKSGIAGLPSIARDMIEPSGTLDDGALVHPSSMSEDEELAPTPIPDVPYTSHPLLTFTDADGQEHTVGLGWNCTIGRAEGNTITLNDQRASKRHVEIKYADGTYRLIDLGAANGTMVNGSYIDQHTLRHADRILIGRTTLLFQSPQVLSEPLGAYGSGPSTDAEEPSHRPRAPHDSAASPHHDAPSGDSSRGAEPERDLRDLLQTPFTDSDASPPGDVLFEPKLSRDVIAAGLDRLPPIGDLLADTAVRRPRSRTPQPPLVEELDGIVPLPPIAPFGGGDFDGLGEVPPRPEHELDPVRLAELTASGALESTDLGPPSSEAPTPSGVSALPPEPDLWSGPEDKTPSDPELFPPSRRPEPVLLEEPPLPVEDPRTPVKAPERGRRRRDVSDTAATISMSREELFGGRPLTGAEVEAISSARESAYRTAPVAPPVILEEADTGPEQSAPPPEEEAPATARERIEGEDLPEASIALADEAGLPGPVPFGPATSFAPPGSEFHQMLRRLRARVGETDLPDRAQLLEAIDLLENHPYVEAAFHRGGE